MLLSSLVHLIRLCSLIFVPWRVLQIFRNLALIFIISSVKFLLAIYALDYYRPIFVTLPITSGVPDPVFKNTKNILSFNCSLSQKLH